MTKLGFFNLLGKGKKINNEVNIKYCKDVRMQESVKESPIQLDMMTKLGLFNLLEKGKKTIK